MSQSGAPRSCASCDETDCAMHRRHGVDVGPGERSAYVLDDVWPEYASMIASERRPDDQLLAPGIWGMRPARYHWPGEVQYHAQLATTQRHLAIRRVAQARGAVRQQTYLEHDRAVARALARQIDYRAGHLVVAQNWLPWLDEAGALGGRSFDVLMTRYPFAELHRLLDSAAAGFGDSPTIGDFRADQALVDREWTLLRRARKIITPHHGVAALFPKQAARLVWHRPSMVPPAQGDRVAFLGPSIARERPDIVRSLAATLEEPLILFGEILERPDFWDGIRIERRSFGLSWLEGIGTILHPATVTNQPRRLLAAVATGVRVFATEGVGLDPADYLPIAQFAEHMAEAAT